MSVEQFLNNANKLTKKKAAVDEKVDIEKPFVKHAKSLGCTALKLILLNLRGWPDRTILCPEGRILFIEFKRPGKPQTPAQVKYMNLLKGLGFEYYVCDRPGQAEKILDDFLAF